MILLDKLLQHPTFGPATKPLIDGTVVPLRVHADVMKLATDLLIRDEDKLRKSGPHLFMPADRCWIEWPMGQDGDMGVLFDGYGTVRTGRAVFYGKKHREDAPTFAPLDVDLDKGLIALSAVEDIDWMDAVRARGAIETITPLIFALLALVNSPKIVKRDPARLDRLNRKRLSAGRYTYHPHHVVRLNVDRKDVRVGASDGGDGASRALHFVRAHLRLWNGQYILVQPHWRGDPQVGIVKPAYEVDRTSSRWAS